MPASRVWIRVALVLSGGAASLCLVTAWDEPQAREPSPFHEARCRPGAAPTHDYGGRPPEPFLRYGTRPIVIGCAALASGRRFELVAYQLGRGKRTSLCIDDYDVATGVTSGCGSNLVFGDGAIDAGSTTRSAKRHTIVGGAVSASVRRVVLRYELGGRLHKHLAAVVMVRGRGLLQTIGVLKPFGRYLAEVPPGARGVSAEARNTRRRALGLAFFEGFPGPAGKGPACYSRPRITSLRLFKPARAGHSGWVRVVAKYPGGYIGSVEATLGGRGTAHADLVPARSPREAGRRIVRMPVRFGRRGTVGVDVTAEGRPLDRRCGKNPPLRRSAAKTLLVRVR